MRCNVSSKKLSLYIDGEFTDRESSAIEKHIARCPRCKELLHKLTLVKSSLKHLTPVKESEGFDFEFNRRLQEKLERIHGRRWRVRARDILTRLKDNVVFPVPAAVKVAASFVVVVAVVSFVRVEAIRKIPVVDFVAGDVKIYRSSADEWIIPEVNMRLKSGDRIHSEEGAIFNITSRRRYKARIKDKSLIVLSKIDSGWRNINTYFSISHGNLLVNTTDEFKGSNLKIETPACEAEVVGTAFMVRVMPESNNATWLGVLKGRVKVTSKVHPLEAADIREAVAYVSSGQRVVVEPYQYPSVPELFSEKEWRMMQELYQLAEVQRIILLIGTEADRIEELLRPAPIYIPGIQAETIPKDIQNIIGSIIEATREDGLGSDILHEHVVALESLLERFPDPRYDVELLMFIASHYHHTRDYKNAIRVFQKVITDYTGSPLTSLAQCAIATIYQQDLKDIKQAEKAYRLLIETYPDSIDAVRARKFLTLRGHHNF